MMKPSRRRGALALLATMGGGVAQPHGAGWPSPKPNKSGRIECALTGWGSNNYNSDSCPPEPEGWLFPPARKPPPAALPRCEASGYFCGADGRCDVDQACGLPWLTSGASMYFPDFSGCDPHCTCNADMSSCDCNFHDRPSAKCDGRAWGGQKCESGCREDDLRQRLERAVRETEARLAEERRRVRETEAQLAALRGVLDSEPE